METPSLVEWQKIDEENNLVMPWLTWDSLEAIKKLSLEDKTIVMFGAGLGDSWLAARCKKLYIIERNNDWLVKSMLYSAANMSTNIEYIFRPCNDSDGKAEYYTELPNDDIDVIINDDAYRTEVCQVAVDYFSKKPFGGIVIVDNWQQDFVFISPKAEEIMKPYDGSKQRFVQKEHTNHEGRPWNTCIWYI